MTRRRAKVRPRVTRPGDSAVLTLDSLIDALPRTPGDCLCLVGPPGAGKTTALEHLGFLLRDLADSEARLQPLLLDDPDELELHHALCERPVVCASASPPRLRPVWTLQPWGPDELIEYGLKLGPGASQQVVRRALAIYEHATFSGDPAAWSAILDLLAHHAEAVTALDVLEAALAGLTPKQRGGLQRACLTSELQGRALLKLPQALPGEARRLVSHPEFRLLLSAREMARDLARGRHCAWLADPLAPEVVLAVAAQLVPKARAKLGAVMAGGPRGHEPMAASILHAAGEPILYPPHVPHLAGALLERVALRGAMLNRLVATGAHMPGADLSGASHSLRISCLA